MNILYGVCGEGFGHSSRALSIATHLEKKGHKVIILTYGQALKVLKKRFNVFPVTGLEMKFVRGILKKRKTLKFNIKKFPKNFKFRKLKKFYSLMKDFNPDLCITDMEPIVPILSNWFRIPLVSTDNQHRITNLEIDVPKKYYKDFLIAKSVVKTFCRKADDYIITSFGKSKIKKRNTHIVPPMIRSSIKKLKPVKKNKVLVYMSRKNRNILRVLKNFEKENFVIYGYNKNLVRENLNFKTSESFIDDLKECSAIIATAGFTLISEALYLKKPYFALPLKGQFEQVLNALMLKKSGFGNYSEKITKEELQNFLNNLKKYENKLKKTKFKSDDVFRVLDRVIKKYERDI